MYACNPRTWRGKQEGAIMKRPGRAYHLLLQTYYYYCVYLGMCVYIQMRVEDSSALGCHNSGVFVYLQTEPLVGLELAD